MMAPSLKQSVTDAVVRFVQLNVALAGCNLVPVPFLDGGRIVLIPLEKLIGQKAYQVLLNVTGILLVLLVVWITAKDILRIFGL
jgi:regulator of sigma E protease